MEPGRSEVGVDDNRVPPRRPEMADFNKKERIKLDRYRIWDGAANILPSPIPKTYPIPIVPMYSSFSFNDMIF